MQKTRRYAALMCTVSALVFVAVVALATRPAEASMRRCQQECDAEYSTGAAHCNQFSGPDYTDCMGEVQAEYNYCSYGAYWCSEGTWTCYLNCEYSPTFGTFGCEQLYWCVLVYD